jgi:hypothetical protein
MPRATSTRKATPSTPARSANALRAYAAGSVTSTIDLTMSPARVTVPQRAQSAVRRNATLLGIAASVVWIYDLARIVG